MRNSTEDSNKDWPRRKSFAVVKNFKNNLSLKSEKKNKKRD